MNTIESKLRQNKLDDILEKLPINTTIQELSLLWSREVLRRNCGNRLKSSETLGVSYRSMLRYVGQLRAAGLDVHDKDKTAWRKRGSKK